MSLREYQNVKPDPFPIFSPCIHIMYMIMCMQNWRRLDETHEYRT